MLIIIPQIYLVGGNLCEHNILPLYPISLVRCAYTISTHFFSRRYSVCVYPTTTQTLQSKCVYTHLDRCSSSYLDFQSLADFLYCAISSLAINSCCSKPSNSAQHNHYDITITPRAVAPSPHYDITITPANRC